MIEVVLVGLGGLASLLALYAALYVGAAVISPRFFLDHLSLNDERFKKLGRTPASPPTLRWGNYVASAALLVGLLILMFHAAGALTMWVPSSWMETGEDGERRWVGWSVQLLIGFFFFVAISDAFLSRDANAHRLVRPTGHRLSSWARRGYDRADTLIKDTKAAKLGEIDLQPGYSTMEFVRGFDLRLAEEGDRDAGDGRYRSAAFEDRDAYVETWRRSATRFCIGGWHHLKIEEVLKELELSEKAEATALEKEYWKSTLGFDPDEVLRET